MLVLACGGLTPWLLCCDDAQGPIWKSIQWLDEEGMKAIETVRPHTARPELMRRPVPAVSHRGGRLVVVVLPLQGQPEPFTRYLTQYRNTICGRHPIGVLLNVSARKRRHAGVSCQEGSCARVHKAFLGKPPCGVCALHAQMLQHCSSAYEVKFRHYDQSSHCEHASDSSVSYASATVVRVAAGG